MVITSAQNPKIKEVKKLWKRKEREVTDLFLIEGFRELSRAAHRIHFKVLFFCPTLFLGDQERALIAEIGVPSFEVDERVFCSLSYRDRPDGLIGVAYQSHQTVEQLGVGDFYIVAEALEKPGNLGSLLRSSDAAGVDGVIVSDRLTDVHNPNVVRASVGTLFTQPVVELSNEESCAWLKEREIAIVAATPHAEKLYTECDFTQPVAIVVGTEQLGLSDFWMERADLQVRIPMRGVADSLNVATATTLLLYEVVRQRHQKK